RYSPRSFAVQTPACSDRRRGGMRPRSYRLWRERVASEHRGSGGHVALGGDSSAGIADNRH
ncbi:MAG TPA: hypothetical protein VHZ27_03825, partial [Solirubrobacteraceae bacterium]|nr:hypothetical protein [Solirubrobacteraceae bacterium]